MMWWLVMAALAGPRSDVRAALDDGRYDEAAGTCLRELLEHPGRGWAVRGLTTASDTLAEQHLARARRLWMDGQVVPGQEALADARRVLSRASRAGATVDPVRIDIVEAQLLADAASALRQRADAAEAAGRWSEAVAARTSARALVPDDGEALAETLRRWSQWHQGQGDLLAAAKKREEAAAVSGQASDREAAAALHAERGRRLLARGACRQAAEVLRGASHLHGEHEVLHEQAVSCAMIDVVLAVRVDGDDGLTRALAARVEEVLRERGSRYLRVATVGQARPHTVAGPEGPVQRPAPFLVLSVTEATSTQGEVTTTKERRGHGRSITTVHEAHTMPVTARWRGELLVRVGEEVVVRRPLAADATTTARWDGKAKQVEVGPLPKHRVKAPRARTRGPAVDEARQASVASVVRTLASEVVTATLDVVDRPVAIPPPPADLP